MECGRCPGYACPALETSPCFGEELKPRLKVGMRPATEQTRSWMQSSDLFWFSACCACSGGVAPVESAALYQPIFGKFVLLNPLCKLQGVPDYQHKRHSRLLRRAALGLFLFFKGFLLNPFFGFISLCLIQTAYGLIACVNKARERKKHNPTYGRGERRLLWLKMSFLFSERRQLLVGAALTEL